MSIKNLGLALVLSLGVSGLSGLSTNPVWAGETAAIKATSEGDGSAHSAAALGGGFSEESNSNNTLNQTSSPTATQSNIAVQNNVMGQFGFGDSIYCPGPTLSVSGFGAQSPHNHNVGGVVSLNIPLGGSAKRSCEDLAKEIAYQRQLDTKLNLINFCRDLQKNGGRLTDKAPEDLKLACSYVDFSEPEVQVIMKEEPPVEETPIVEETKVVPNNPVPTKPREIETSPGLN